MFGIGSIFKLRMLRELIPTVNLVNHVLCGLRVVQSLSWNKYWRAWTLYLLRLIRSLSGLPRKSHVRIHWSLLCCVLRTTILHSNLLLGMWAHFIIALVRGNTVIRWDISHHLISLIVWDDRILIHSDSRNNRLTVHLILIHWERSHLGLTRLPHNHIPY